MSYFIHVASGRYPLSEMDIRAENPNTSFPFPFQATDAYAEVLPTECPSFNNITHELNELPPVLAGGEFHQVWEVTSLSPEQVAANQAANAQRIQSEIVSATQKRLDDFARTRNYDGILSLCTYATSAAPKFQTEGQYGVTCRDATWAALYQVMAEVEAGNLPMPTGYADIEPDLPALVWPTAAA